MKTTNYLCGIGLFLIAAFVDFEFKPIEPVVGLLGIVVMVRSLLFD